MDLKKVFSAHGGRVYAVNGVSFRIEAGEAVALVGESGSGKSTVAKCLVRLIDPSEGQIVYRGRDVTNLSDGEFRPLRDRIQMVFQDPTMSLNPRLTVKQTLSEPLKLHGVVKNGSLDTLLGELMDQVNLDRRLLGRRPHQMSAGQKQRVGIARAIATEPKFIVLDEPTPRSTWRSDADRRPAPSPAGASSYDLSLHLARSEYRSLPLQPGRRHVPRDDRRGRAGRGDLHASEAPVHPGVALCGPDSRSNPAARAAAGRAAGRDPASDGGAGRVPPRRSLPIRPTISPNRDDPVFRCRDRPVIVRLACCTRQKRAGASQIRRGRTCAICAD